jgi:histone H3/H4
MNIRELMKKESKYKVSSKAADAYESMIKAALEYNVAIIDEMIENEGRKIINEDDVLRLFSYLEIKTILK